MFTACWSKHMESSGLYSATLWALFWPSPAILLECRSDVLSRLLWMSTGLCKKKQHCEQSWLGAKDSLWHFGRGARTTKPVFQSIPSPRSCSRAMYHSAAGRSSLIPQCSRTLVLTISKLKCEGYRVYAFICRPLSIIFWEFLP